MVQDMQEFGRKIRVGELVVFPTETVYGIGANAFDENAVAKIFTAKGRPGDNPLIVHISSYKDIHQVASSVDILSQKLFERFSPGPITILLPKQETIPNIVTAGSSLVGVRIPSHPLAQELLRAAGVPIAAPSANKSGRPSATHHDHVIESFGDELPNVIRGGKTFLGLESTVVIANSEKNQIIILRQGAISQEEIQKAFPNVSVNIANKEDLENAPSPGIKYRHYAPKGEVILMPQNISFDEIVKLYNSFDRVDENVVLLCSEEFQMNLPKTFSVISLGSEKNLSTIAKNLFSALIECDNRGITKILIQSFPEEGLGRTIMERIKRSAEAT